jgi:glycosyltransferase involved in cell wall biosynthesis
MAMCIMLTKVRHHLNVIDSGPISTHALSQTFEGQSSVRLFMGDVLPVTVTVILPTRNEEEALGPTIDAIPRGWCKDLEIMIVDGNSSDRTREIALEKGIRVHLEDRKGYGRAYRTGFDVAKNDIIVTMDADCTYPAELVPDLVKRLIDDDLEFITCDRLSLAEDGSMSGLHGFGNWMLSFTARLLFGYGVKDSQSGMWVFNKSIFDDEKMRPTNDGMPLSEEMKILARRTLGKQKAVEISVPYRPRVGEAEIHTWGDGWKNLKFLFARRLRLHKTLTPWGGRDTNPDSTKGDLPEQA